MSAQTDAKGAQSPANFVEAPGSRAASSAGRGSILNDNNGYVQIFLPRTKGYAIKRKVIIEDAGSFEIKFTVHYHVKYAYVDMHVTTNGYAVYGLGTHEYRKVATIKVEKVSADSWKCFMKVAFAGDEKDKLEVFNAFYDWFKEERENIRERELRGEAI